MPKNLLLADDSITIQKVVGITFAGEDFKITAVDNGEDAIARARELRPDVVLADVVMPRKNGYEVCEALKADPALQHIPVLLLAGTFESFDESRAHAVRADGHIAKPFESQALINKVKELLGSALPKAEAAHAVQAVDPRQVIEPVAAPAAAPAPRPVTAVPRAPASPPPGGPASVRPPVGAPPPGRAPMPGMPPVAAIPRAAMPPGVRSPPPGMPPGARPPVRPPPGLRPPIPVPPAPGVARSPVAPLFGARPQPSGAPGARPPSGGPAAYPESAALPSAPAPLTAASPASPAAEARPAKPPSVAPRPSSPGLGTPSQKPPPPSAAAAAPRSSGEDDWSDLDVSDAAAEPTPDVHSAAPGRAASAPVAPPSAPSSPVAAAEVVGLDDLDFGEPSPFAAPPRPAVEHAPEQPEAIDLPMLEAEEEIELVPASELVPKAEETGHEPEARATLAAAPPLEPGDSSSLTRDRAPAPPLAVESEADLEVAPPPASLPTLIPSAHPRGDLPPPGEGVALQAATPMAATPGAPSAAAAPDGGEAQLRDALSHASREVIERIAWEVVPQLAETIIREQLERLVKDRQR